MAVNANDVTVTKTVPSAPIKKGCCVNMCRPVYASNSPEVVETIVMIPESGVEDDDKKGSTESDAASASSQVVRRKIREGKSKSKSSKNSDKTHSHTSGKRKSKKSAHKENHTENKIKCCGATCSSTYNLFSWLSSPGGGPMSFKQGAFFFCGGVAVGIGAALLFFKTGGAAAVAVGGLAGLGVSTGAKSDIKGSNNTVVGSGSNSLFNINQVKGGSEQGADKLHKLTFAGMSEELKLECLKRGMIYIDKATDSWWAYDSVSGGARCLTNIPENMIMGDCKIFYHAEQLKHQKAQASFEFNRAKIAYEHNTEMLNQKNKFSGGTGTGIKFNWMGLPENTHKFGKRSVPKFKPQTPKMTPTQKARMDFLNATRGEQANQADFKQGLQWLKNATDKK